MRKPILVLLLYVASALGCDPAHTSHTFVDLPAGLGQGSPPLVKAMNIVATTAREMGFEEGKVQEDRRRPGLLQQFGRGYAHEPQLGGYRTVVISSRKRPDKDQFEVEIFEFLTSAETEYARSVRVALRDRFIEHFGEGAVRSSAK